MSSLRILFVEDNHLSSIISCTYLRELGYDVIEAFCAEEAVGIIDKHEVLSALVTDINLGVGEDGFHVARCARVAYPDLPVVFVSAAAGARVALESVRPSEFIAKPFHPRQIMDALERSLSMNPGLVAH
jgi:CheY-like chemotaxis protein